jgi:predicted esterase YcpF (UPF0227 family)
MQPGDAMPLNDQDDTKVYCLPGFGSTAKSEKARAIGAWCKARGMAFEVLEYPSSYDPDTVFHRHVERIAEGDYSRRIFVGCSLGGFWAAVHATAWRGKSVLINPATDPSESLRKYLTEDGMVAGFHDAETKALTAEMIAGYAAYLERMLINRYGRIVLLCADDEVLDHRVAQSLFDGNSQVIVLPKGGHSGSMHVALFTQCIEQLTRIDVEHD